MADEPEVPRVFALRLPLSTRIRAAESAEREGMSLNQFVALAVAEKIARLASPDPGASEEPSPAVEEPSSPRPIVTNPRIRSS